MKVATDISQSKILTEILPKESADMHYVKRTRDFMGNEVNGEFSYPKYGNPDSKYANYMVQNFASFETIPAWSLSALLNYLKEIDFFPTIEADEVSVRMEVVYMDIPDEDYDKPTIPCQTIYVQAEDFIDACVELIIKLKE